MGFNKKRLLGVLFFWGLVASFFLTPTVVYGAVFQFSDSVKKLCVGDVTTVSIDVQRDNEPIDIAELYINYDSEVIEVEDVEFHRLYQSGRHKISKGEERSTLIVTALKLDRKQPGNNFNLAKIKFRTKKAGKSKISIESAEYSGVGQEEGSPQLENSSLEFEVGSCHKDGSTNGQEKIGWFVSLFRWVRSLLGKG